MASSKHEWFKGLPDLPDDYRWGTTAVGLMAGVAIYYKGGQLANLSIEMNHATMQECVVWRHDFRLQVFESIAEAATTIVARHKMGIKPQEREVF